MDNATRPVARWTTVRENGRNRLVMSWSVPAAASAAAPAARPAAVPSAA